MTNADLAARADECLGLRKPAAQRTVEQAQRIKTLVDVVKTPESSLVGHLNWGTFMLRDVVQKSGGAPFGNERVRWLRGFRRVEQQPVMRPGALLLGAGCFQAVQ